MVSRCEVQVFQAAHQRFLDNYERTLRDLRDLRDRICTDLVSTEEVGGDVMIQQIADRVQGLRDEIRRLRVIIDMAARKPAPEPKPGLVAWRRCVRIEPKEIYCRTFVVEWWPSGGIPKHWYPIESYEQPVETIKQLPEGQKP